MAPCPRERRALGLRDLLAKLVQSVSDRGIEDEIAHAEHDAAKNVGVDLAGELNLEPGLLADAVADAADGLLVQLNRARDLDRQQMVLVVPHLIEAIAD